MKNLHARRAAVACVAISLTTLGITSCGSNAKGGATSSASASAASAGPTSSTAVVTTAPATTVATTASAAPSSGTAKAAPNPCSLVTAADAGAALGSSVPAGLHQQAGLFDACIYTRGSASIVVLVRNIDRTTFDTSAKANPGGAIPVTGVGDDAYNASNTLLVWQSGTEIGIQLQGGSADALTTEKGLATAAVARL